MLDPLALLFLFSSSIGLWLLWRASRERSRRTRSRRRNRFLWTLLTLIIWVVVFQFSSAPYVVNPLIATLENQYPASASCAAGSHFVVLGGGVDSRVEAVSDFHRMSKATHARVTRAAQLANLEPDTRLIVAGGALRKIAEADVMSAYLQQLGINVNRIMTESESASTRENVLNIAKLLLNEEVQGAVRLVSSAAHMPRAVGALRHVLSDTGIQVCPVSVDIQALNNVPLSSWMPQVSALVKFDIWLHEVVALMLYRIKGWI